MKKRKNAFVVALLLVCAMGLVVLSGCETAKGFGRDIKAADQWMRDHLW